MSDVINIGDIAVERGFWKTKAGHCRHKRLSYSTQDRSIHCKDCELQVDPFDAFVGLVGEFDLAQKRINYERAELEKGVTLKAAQLVEKAWRRRNMVPTCPHCREAIFSTDGFGGSLTNKDHAKQKRAFVAKNKPETATL